jgi:O-methyltransferase involved in polyketide biosynthesis
MTDPLIRNISDTARWVATYRARETERPNALFRDAYAKRLAGERGEQIAAAVPNISGTHAVRAHIEAGGEVQDDVDSAAYFCLDEPIEEHRADDERPLLLERTSP